MEGGSASSFKIHPSKFLPRPSTLVHQPSTLPTGGGVEGALEGVVLQTTSHAQRGSDGGENRDHHLND